MGAQFVERGPNELKTGHFSHPGPPTVAFGCPPAPAQPQSCAIIALEITVLHSAQAPSQNAKHKLQKPKHTTQNTNLAAPQC